MSVMFAEFVSPSGLGNLWAVRGGIRVSNFYRCCWHWNGADRVGYFEGANDANDGDIWLALTVNSFCRGPYSDVYDA